MTNDFLPNAKKALLRGNRIESIRILIGNTTDSDIVRQLEELEIRLNSLVRKNTAGTIDFEDVQMEENRISSSILSIISNMERKEERASKLFPNKAKKSFDVKWLVIAVLVCGLLGLGYVVLSKKGEPNKIPIDPCARVICDNGGKCNNGECKCPPGYEGKRCETKKAEEPKTEGFKMVVEDVFSITGRGTIATGKILSGEIRKGDALRIMVNGEEIKTVCLRIEMFRKEKDTAKKGDSVGLLLRGVDKGDLKRGMVLRK